MNNVQQWSPTLSQAAKSPECCSPPSYPAQTASPSPGSRNNVGTFNIEINAVPAMLVILSPFLPPVQVSDCQLIRMDTKRIQPRLTGCLSATGTAYPHSIPLFLVFNTLSSIINQYCKSFLIYGITILSGVAC
jgi:hypothetical protein